MDLNANNTLCKNKDTLIPNSYRGVHELKYSCSSVHNGETKNEIISKSTENQQESIKGKWSSSGATEHAKGCQDYFDWLHSNTLSIKNRYYDRKVRQLLEIDMAVVRYWEDKVLNRDNGNFVKINAWKTLFRKMKTRHWNFMSRCVVLFDQFENGFNQRGRNITLLTLWLV